MSDLKMHLYPKQVFTKELDFCYLFLTLCHVYAKREMHLVCKSFEIREATHEFTLTIWKEHNTIQCIYWGKIFFCLNGWNF